MLVNRSDSFSEFLIVLTNRKLVKMGLGPDCEALGQSGRRQHTLERLVATGNQLDPELR